jgi:hypothetical protein
MTLSPAPRQATLATRPIADAQTIGSALSLIERLRETLAAESAEVARRGRVDYEAYNWRKAQALLELSRFTPVLGLAPSHPRLRTAVAGLNAALEKNARILSVQLKAAKAVADLVARAVRDGQSDGTYSAMAWREGYGD